MGPGATSSACQNFLFSGLLAGGLEVGAVIAESWFGNGPTSPASPVIDPDEPDDAFGPYPAYPLPEGVNVCPRLCVSLRARTQVAVAGTGSLVFELVSLTAPGDTETVLCAVSYEFEGPFASVNLGELFEPSMVCNDCGEAIALAANTRIGLRVRTESEDGLTVIGTIAVSASAG